MADVIAQKVYIQGGKKNDPSYQHQQQQID